MSYLPPVVARLSFDLGDFDAKIAEAKEKIRSLAGSETVTVKVAPDRNSLSSLEKISREAGRINGSSGAMRLRLIDGTKTWTELTAIDEKMNRLNGKTARMNVKVNTDDKGGFLNSLKNTFGGGHSFNLPFTNMTANPAGLAAIGAGIAALLPELAGLVSGFAAAGAGAGAFAALAAPAIKHVTTAYGNLKSAQQAYNAAKQKEQIDPSKANAAALVKAADNLKLVQKQIGQMPAAEQAAITGISNLSSTFGKMSKKFEPKAFEVFSSGLRLIGTLLPHLTPFANTFADSLSKILGNLDKSAKGKGFQDFMKSFHGIEGPALQAIGAGIGNVAGSIGRLLTVMSGKDVAHAINIAFSAISGTIGGVTAAVKVLMRTWHGIQGLAGVGKDMVRDLVGLPGTIVGIAAKIVGSFAGIGHKIASGFDGVRHDIAAKFDGIKGVVVAKFAGAGAWLADKAHAIASAFDNVRHDIAAKFDGVKGTITAKFSGAIGWLVSAGKSIMDGLLAGITSSWNKVATFLSSLAGKIKSLKGPLDYDQVMLYPHGQAIMQGLMGGMQSQVPTLEAQLRGITNTISGTAGKGHAGAGGGVIEVHSHVHLDGREIYSGVQRQAVATQRRTGHNGMTKRTR